ncbi:hypothetical protein [Paraburkholderia silvatlantica]|uniref:Secreted protein n=1 Tax=Paraburkholderia silvatlantica TaxID=321895 RepID=A0ABR6FKN7_9BURK|nr:hypothetical protein [Paraburkholderia silvatlantica]MBB2927375.1 hypothetical protein [Paraburkholderia silvatlantica]PVY37090.1 hypothetical protein C7411_102383 [Paraburkholderia silvatlantica]PXW41632.1 hypothetical protein C7413_10238 [Paraburkholderia silvatlantica]
MHVAWASFTSAFAAPVTAVTVAVFFASEVAARTREVSRIVLRRQPASRPLPTAIANDTMKNEARHVA